MSFFGAVSAAWIGEKATFSAPAGGRRGESLAGGVTAVLAGAAGDVQWVTPSIGECWLGDADMVVA